MTAQDRFWVKVDRGPGCWEWTASKTTAGYGQFGLRQGENVMAHRFAYEALVGPIPEGLHIDHLCRNRGCVNPDHLEPVTCGENVRRGARARVACKHGHPYTEDNTYRSPKTGRRQCRICRREAMRRHKARRSA